MQWIKRSLWGIANWVILFIFSLMLIGVRLTDENLISLATLLVSAAILWVLSKICKINSVTVGLKVGVLWLVLSAALDYFIIVQKIMLGDTSLYLRWPVILGYSLIVIVPAVYGQMNR